MKTTTTVTKIKAPARRELDAYTCGIIIGRYQLKQRISAIARDLGIPRTTVNDCVDRYKKSGSGVNKKRAGRPPKSIKSEP